MIKYLFLSKSSSSYAQQAGTGNSVKDITFSMDLLGDYSSLGKFLISLEKSSRLFEVTILFFSASLVSIATISISQDLNAIPISNSNKRIDFNLQLKLIRIKTMAVVFISPKQRQKMFFMGITVVFLLILIIISLGVFLAQPKTVSPVLVFNKPKVNIDMTIFDSDQFKNLEPFAEMEIQYSYNAQQKTIKSRQVLFQPLLQTMQAAVLDKHGADGNRFTRSGNRQRQSIYTLLSEPVTAPPQVKHGNKKVKKTNIKL